MDFSQLLMYVPGAIMFLVGTNQSKQFLLQSRKNACAEGTVKSCNHVQKKDSKARDIFNYYDVSVKYNNPGSNHVYTKTIQSPSPYQLGQKVKLFLNGKGDKVSIISQENEYPLHPLFILAAGVLMLFLTMAESKGQEPLAMLCLVGVLFAGGISLVLEFIRLKRKHLVAVDSSVIDIYSRQVSKESKILKGARFTYYPIVSYLVDGAENYRLCNVNSSNEKTFKVGSTLELYYSPISKTVTEKHARPLFLALGIILIVCSVVGLLSVLPVII